jgi:hypothetical protein
MSDLPILAPGHIHTGTTVAGIGVRIWPTPDPERWHVGTSRPQATTEPVNAEEIPALLEEWRVEVTFWTCWAGSIHDRNPDLDVVEGQGKPVTEW